MRGERRSPGSSPPPRDIPIPKTDSLVLKWAQWYCLLCGLFWPLVPLGAVLFAACPFLLRSQLLKKTDPARGVAIADNLRRSAIRAIRLELLLIVAFHAALFWLL